MLNNKIIKKNYDYFPFGMEMPNFGYKAEEYRYGFNGMEKDNEMKGKGNSYTTLFRQYDPRVIRWWSVDPKPTASVSYFAAYENNPIMFTDILGDSVDLGNLTATDKRGKLLYREQVEAFEGFLSTPTGKKWIEDRAQAGFSYQGQIFKDLSINVENEGDLSKQGIDYIFNVNWGDGYATGATKAKLDYLNSKDRVKILTTIGGYGSGKEGYFDRMYESQNTILHEIGYHGSCFEDDFLSGNYKTIGNSKGIFIDAYRHDHYFEPTNYSLRLTDKSIKNSLFGKRAFIILKNTSEVKELNKSDNEILKTMRQGFHSYPGKTNKRFEGLINRKK